MLLAHIADLHLGKTLHERDLLPDQAFMLDGVLDLLARRRPAALLIAGDVYDRSIPTPEALALFDSFLSRALRAAQALVVAVIPGNHDSAARLSFGAELLERAGVHFRTRAEDCARPILVKRDGERLAIWPLPFLTPGAFDSSDRDSAGGADGADGAEGEAEEMRGAREEALSTQDETRREPGESARSRRPTALRSQAELFAEGINRIRPALLSDSANVLLAHCFAAGGAESESERLFVGGAEQVDPRCFADFDYVALGHLHRHQSAGPRALYPGSPLAYSFGEGGDERGILFVDVRQGGFEAELAPLRPLRNLVRLEGPFSALSAPGAFPEHREAYVEARLTDGAPVLNPAEALRINFPNLLSVRQAAFELLPSAASAPGPRIEGGRSVVEDFRAFHAEMRGAEPGEAMTRLFTKLLEDAHRETA